MCDFVIENGILLKYIGPADPVSITVPDGVTALGEHVFC